MPRPVLDVDLETSERLGRIRQKGTTAELEVRAAVTSLGLRYRVSNGDLPGRPDLANRARKWAVFVHGCFWHRHKDCYRTTTPKRNRAFWVAKFTANRRRDARVIEELRRDGFAVFVVWECETTDAAKLGRRMSSLLRRIVRENG